MKIITNKPEFILEMIFNKKRILIFTLITWREIINSESIDLCNILASVDVVSFHSDMCSNALTTKGNNSTKSLTTVYSSTHLASCGTQMFERF